MAENPFSAEDEEQLALLLESFSEASGIPLEEIMASEFEIPLTFETMPDIEPEFTTGEIGAEELEEAREDFDLSNPFDDASGDYLDELMDDLDVDPGDEDSYGEAEV